MLEMTGSATKIEGLLQVLRETGYEVLEVSRTGRMAMRRGHHTSRVLKALGTNPTSHRTAPPTLKLSHKTKPPHRIRRGLKNECDDLTKFALRTTFPTRPDPIRALSPDLTSLLKTLSNF